MNFEANILYDMVHMINHIRYMIWYMIYHLIWTISYGPYHITIQLNDQQFLSIVSCILKTGALRFRIDFVFKMGVDNLLKNSADFIVKGQYKLLDIIWNTVKIMNYY